MAENPLMPHAELRALHKLLRRALDPVLCDAQPRPARKISQKTIFAQDRAALLAGGLLQLRHGDAAVSFSAGEAVSQLLLAEGRASVANASFAEGPRRFHLAAGLAAGLRRAGERGAVLAYAQSDMPEPGWADALTWAQEERLPLVLAIADPSGPELFRTGASADPGILAWPHVQKKAAKLQLPVLTVDGDDAVAVYRVVQESLLRARSGGGPALLWAALPAKSSRRPRPAQAPAALGKLEAYMTARQIRFS